MGGYRDSFHRVQAWGRSLAGLPLDLPEDRAAEEIAAVRRAERGDRPPCRVCGGRGFHYEEEHGTRYPCVCGRDETAAAVAPARPECRDVGEPLAYWVQWSKEDTIGVEMVFPTRRQAEEHIADERAEGDDPTIVPLGLWPPRGWLTEEERALLLPLAEAWEKRATELEQPGTWGNGLPKPQDLRADAHTIRSLLSRTAPPPEVDDA